MDTTTNLKVLVVDDEKDFADAVRSLVKRWGYDAEIAYSGEQAISIARSLEPHVVLLDIIMPGMDGYAVSPCLKAMLGKKTYIIGVTALGASESRYKGYDCGFDHYLIKPIESSHLKKILENYKCSLILEQKLKVHC